MNSKWKARACTRCLCILACLLPPFEALAQSADENDEHHDIEEIIVQATALPRTVEQLSQPTSVLRDDELAQKASASIGETLSSELGLSSTYFGPVASRPVIRGQFGERVRVLSNGLDSLDASALSEDHQSSVEGILAERVEIVRGPATLLYGSGAAGGLVNVVDNRMAERAPETPFSGTLALNSSTAIGELAGAGWVKFGNDALTLHLDHFDRRTDDVEVPGFVESGVLRALEDAEGGLEEGETEAWGTVENSDSSTSGGAVAGTWRGDTGFVGVSFSTFDSAYGVPAEHAHEDTAPPPGGEPVEEVVRIDLEQQRVDLRGEFGFDALFDELTFRFAGNDYEHLELEGSEVGTRYVTDGFDGRLELRHRPVGRLEGALGVQFKRIDFNAVGEEAFVPASDTKRTSIFAFEEFAVSDRTVLQGSLRVEKQTIDGATLGIPYDDTAVGVAVGGIWSIDGDMSLAAHYSLTERHPNSTELYADGPHVAAQRFEVGTVAQGLGILRKETSRNLDLTLRGNTERIDWTLTGFVNQADDYIVLAPTELEEDGFQVWQFEQVDAELYGYEAEARIELFDTTRGHLHAKVFSDLVRGEESASGENLPRLPPLRAGLGLHYTMDALEMSVEATRFTEQDRTAPNELPTDGYVMLGASVSWAMDEKGLFVFLKGSNLTDEDARQHSSPLKDVVPLPGRALHAGLRFVFD